MQVYVASNFRRFVSIGLLWTAVFLVPPGEGSLFAQEHVSSQHNVSTGTFLEVSGIDSAGKPLVFEDVVVFTYEQNSYARYVAIAFEHEDFQNLHVFTARRRTDRPDLFYFAYPVDSLAGELRYRLIVDGVWLTDPHAPQVLVDDRGVSLGVVTLSDTPSYERKSPQVHEDGTVSFFFSMEPDVTPTLESVDARQLRISSFDHPRISLAGTFNGWDPYMHVLQGPDTEGFYSIRLPLPEGPHYYYFMIDGRRVLDPFNDERARDLQTGTLVSRFTLEHR